MAVADTLHQLPPLYKLIDMLELEIIERSLMFGYVLGYCSDTDTYIIYSVWLSDEVEKVINSVLECYPKACVTIVTDIARAKQVSHSPQWLTALQELG